MRNRITNQYMRLHMYSCMHIATYICMYDCAPPDCGVDLNFRLAVQCLVSNKRHSTVSQHDKCCDCLEYECVCVYVCMSFLLLLSVDCIVEGFCFNSLHDGLTCCTTTIHPHFIHQHTLLLNVCCVLCRFAHQLNLT